MTREAQRSNFVEVATLILCAFVLGVALGISICQMYGR